jgi:hypothetical protein
MLAITADQKQNSQTQQHCPKFLWYQNDFQTLLNCPSLKLHWKHLKVIGWAGRLFLENKLLGLKKNTAITGHFRPSHNSTTLTPYKSWKTDIKQIVRSVKWGSALVLWWLPHQTQAAVWYRYVTRVFRIKSISPNRHETALFMLYFLQWIME